MSMKDKLITISVLACSLLAMLFSFFNIINWMEDNKKTKKSINKVQEITKVEISPISTFFSVDFTELIKINDEVVAWIKVDETSVNYPVVKHKDNSYYLTHSYDKSFNYAGWIYKIGRASCRERV